jgi:peptide/nickel transport system permease protein
LGLFIVHRLASLIATLLATAMVVFLVLEVLPGDPAAVVLGVNATPETLAVLHREFGLDDPAPWRFLLWLKGLATGDLGLSYAYRVPISGLIIERMAVTLPLALGSVALASLIGVPAGFLAAARVGRFTDMVIMGLAQIGLAVPGFWLGILLVLAFSVTLGWLPAGGFPGWGDPPAALSALALPTLALALPQAAIIARIARAAVLECHHEDWVRTARIKGLSHGQILMGHVARNAAIPITTVIGLQFAYLIAGAIIIERAFVLPGLGTLAYQAIGQHDIIVVKNLVLVFAALVIVTNFAVEIVHGLIDPRLTRAR